MIRRKKGLFTISLVLLGLFVFSFSAFAGDPKYSKSSTFGPKITDGITEEFLAMIREDPDIAKGKPLRLSGAITVEDLSKLAPLADILGGMEISSAKDLTDLSPLASLSGLTFLKLDGLKGVTTLAPLGALTAMKKLEIK
ncbi:MAG TPA: hypothetical protein PK364_09320, partial [Synergistaceae bacterium]|nr:hypothetical protein [Synergistaceae bacterium]